MSKARNLSLLSTVEAGATTDQTKADIDALGINRGRKNIISNGGFQISQRGDYTATTSASDNTFYVDRFRTVASAVSISTQHTTVSIGGVSKKAYKVTATSAATGYFGSRHGLELLDLEVGATYTISCLMRSNKSNARIRQDTIGAVSADSTMSHTGGGDWEKITFTVDSTNTVANCALQFICYPASAVSVGDYIEITDVQMEKGSVATDFEHRSYGEELLLCQRYYYEVPLTGVDGGYGNKGGNASAYSFNSTGTFAVKMRTTPSTVVSGGTLDGCSAFSVNVSKDGYITRVNPSGTGAYRAFEQKITFSAEL